MLESTLPASLTGETPPPPPARDAALPPSFDISEDPGDSATETKGDTARDRAFQAAPFFWHDRELAPFAIDREGDWLIHRAAIGAPRLGLVFSQGSAFLPDACRILWFCSHDDSEWLRREPGDGTDEDRAHALESRIRAWAVSHIEPGEQTAAVELAFDIYNRAHETRAIAKPEPPRKGTHEGNSPGPS